ncbi:MAG: hypothetical protein NVSMB17_04810 [Candidatus Dormibacteria bacterium]
MRTERLVLEPTSPADVPALFLEIERSHRHLAEWLGWVDGNRMEHTLAYAIGAELAWQKGLAFNFTIHQAGMLVGVITLRRNPDQPLEGNLGYWIAATAAGQGLMTEAAAAVVELAFRAAGMNRVELRAHVDNRASQRVAEKIGMLREGRVRGALNLAAAGQQDAFLYGMPGDDPPRGAGPVSGAAAGADASPDFSRGLLTAVVQDDADGAVLMVAHMDEEAYRRTRTTGHAWFWSRSRKRLWEKGESSGNFLVVRSVTLDCDGDAVLVRAAPAGPACHTGARSCFHNPL